jgi:hypothetical protein
MNKSLYISTLLYEIEKVAISESPKDNSCCNKEFDNFECTRPKNHTGFHIALSDKICVIWARELGE